MGKFIDLAGQRFGRLTVIEFDGIRNQKSFWKCHCDCGNDIVAQGTYLTFGDTKSCGCLKHETNCRFDDLTGKTFGRLFVVERVENSASKQVQYLCRCACGKEKVVLGNHLKSGATKSCGCYMAECTISKNTTHGKTGTRLHRIWSGMKIRCYDTNHKDYKDYGAKGVVMCSEWLGDNGFQNFHDWAYANGYADNLSIDRIDVNGNYEPSNCRWVDSIQQANNKRNNHYVEDNGETLTIAQLARKHKVSSQYLYKLVNKGVSISEAIERANRLSRGKNG